MAKWIAFDDADVSALAQHTNDAVELGVGDPVEVAVSAERPTFIMLPGEAGRVTLVTLQPTPHARRETQRYVASGFLGLTDEIFTEDEIQEEVEEKPWWRRIFRR